MRVDTRPRKRNAPRIAEKSAPGFLQWLRGRPCAIKGCKLSWTWTDGKLQAAHVDYAGDKGTSTKVSDRFAIPLCPLHHTEQHRIGWKHFEAFYRIDALALSKEYWRAWPGRPAWERKLSDG